LSHDSLSHVIHVNVTWRILVAWHTRTHTHASHTRTHTHTHNSSSCHETCLMSHICIRHVMTRSSSWHTRTHAHTHTCW